MTSFTDGDIALHTDEYGIGTVSVITVGGGERLVNIDNIMAVMT